MSYSGVCYNLTIMQCYDGAMKLQNVIHAKIRTMNISVDN